MDLLQERVKLRKIETLFDPMAKAEWDESLHPRDDGGKFSESGVSRQISESPSPASPVDFRKTFESAFEGKLTSFFVNHYNEDELSSMKALVVAHGGKVGIAIKDHGDSRIEGTALYNQGGPKGAGLAMLKYAIDHHGVNYVECFGDQLKKMYEGLGFKVTQQDAFNPEYAPKGWPKELGTPNYYQMRL